MIITKLKLKNFGVYAGENTFQFSGSKPVVLIGGMNGRGKTTFLEAVLLAFYGSNSFAYNESKYRSYGQYLKAYVNKADGSLESYVELEFKLENSNSETYLVRREWVGNSARTREKIIVEKDGEFSNFLTENWAMFMENILPSGLSNFFFFDGEKIAELAVEATNSQMKQSIKALLGITVLDVLENDISRIVHNVSRESSNRVEAKELECLRNKKMLADSILQEADDRIVELSEQLDTVTKKLEKTKVSYAAKGGDIVAQRQKMFNDRNKLKLQIEQDKETLVTMAAGVLPLVQVKSLLEKIRIQAKREHETQVTQLAVSKINSIFSAYTELHREGTESIKNFIHYIEKTAEEENTEIIYDLPDHSLYLLNDMLSSGFAQEIKDMQQLSDNVVAHQKKVDELDSYLSVDIDEEVLAKLYKKMKALEQQKIDLEVLVENVQQKRISLHGESIRATTEYNKYVEELLSHLELKDDSDRILTYSHHATKILDAYRIKLQERKIGTLAHTMTSCYKRLSNKKNLINQIHMDPATLDFEYLNSDGVVVPKESLSAGGV